MSLDKIFSSKTHQDIKRDIVIELLDSNKNLDEKTELDKPLKWSALATIKNFLESKNLSISYQILAGFITQSHKYLISKKRKGRAEYIEALKSLANIDDDEQSQLPSKGVQ